MNSLVKAAVGVLTALVLLTGSGVALAAAQKNGPAFNLALDFRTVDTYFVKSPNYGEESFSLTGLKFDGQYDIRLNKFMISPGLGLAYFFTGDYDFTTSGPVSGSGKDATAFEVDLFVQGAYEVAPRFSLLGRVGLAYMEIFAEGNPSLPTAYSEDFDVELTDLYLSIGGQYDILKNLGIGLAYRFTVAEIDGYTDYGWGTGEPSLESFSNDGFQMRVTYKF